MIDDNKSEIRTTTGPHDVRRRTNERGQSEAGPIHPDETHKTQIILVEDDPAHCALIMECIKQVGIHEEVVHFADGEAAVHHLAHVSAGITEGKGTKVRLAILDVRLPGLDGFDVLRAIKADHNLSQIPATILSTSNSPKDKSTAKKIGADGYYVKPMGIEKMCDILREIQSKWLEY